MPQTAHSIITDLAHRLLPDWQKALLSGQRARLIQEFCLLPARYWDVRGEGHAQAAGYAFKTDGLLFHYLPATPIAPTYRDQVADAEQQTIKPLHPYENTHWHHAMAGFRHYTRMALEAMQAEDWEQGCAYTGWLIHVLQAHSFGIHSLEGPYGTDIFVLQRLFGDAERPGLDPAVILRTPAAPPTAASMRGYVPRLLGYEPNEIAFHLFTRHVESTLSARRLCHQIVLNARMDQAQRNSALFAEMYNTATMLTADVLFTLICLATQRVGNATAHVETIRLSEVAPYQRPWLTTPPYWTRGYTVGYDLDDRGRSIPLQLRLPERNVPITFARGMAVGGHYRSVLAYEIPHDTYATFDCLLGRHARFKNSTTPVHLTLKVGRDTLFDDVMEGVTPAVALHADNPEGRISLTLRAKEGLDPNLHHIIWADPTLTRLPAPF